MPDKFTAMSPELHRYAVQHSHRDELLDRLAQETERVAGDSVVMLSAPEQAALLTLLVRAIGARRALEVGTFTGYGAISIARGLPDDGLLVTCDVNEDWTAIARDYIGEAGLEGRVEVKLGPAIETLAALPAGEPFDFAYVDADKPGYPGYYEQCLRLLRPGGLLVFDNVFLGGEVIDPGADREAVLAMRELNDRIAADPRVHATMLGIADGVTLALKLG